MKCFLRGFSPVPPPRWSGRPDLHRMARGRLACDSRIRTLKGFPSRDGLASVAQLAESLICNQVVAGSTPAASSLHFQESSREFQQSVSREHCPTEPRSPKASSPAVKTAAGMESVAAFRKGCWSGSAADREKPVALDLSKRLRLCGRFRFGEIWIPTDITIT